MLEARAEAFDLFLVDIDLGKGIDGYEVCEVARTSELRIEHLPAPLVDRFRSSAAGPRAALPRQRPRTGFLPEVALDSAVSLLDVHETHALLHALSETGGDKLVAARLVGGGKSTSTAG